jgi:hypothetical protein
MTVQKKDGNTNQAAKNNSGGVPKPISTKTLTISLLVLLAAFGIGMVIREFRSVEQEPVSQTPVTTQPAEEPQVPEIPQRPRIPIERPRPVENVVVEPEPAPQEQVQNEPVYTQDDQAAMRRQQQRQDAMQMISWYSSLTPEEQQQLRQGIMMSAMSLMQRWQTMPPEQAQAEQTQLGEMFRQFRNLPDAEREQGILLIQQQLEQILQSGQQ